LEPDSSIAPVRLARLDGALGAGERIEYEIPYNPTGEQNVVKYNLTLNQLVPGDEISGDVEIIRCDGHQHMGTIPRPCTILLCYETFFPVSHMCTMALLFKPKTEVFSYGFLGSYLTHLLY
jgi:hypothetical protein